MSIDLTKATAVTEVAHTFQPQPQNRALYDDLYGAFGDLYKRTRPLYRKLNP